MVGILIGVAVAYHIAWRQGGLRRARLRVRLGPSDDGASPIAAYLLLPDLQVSHFVAAIPIQIDNKGSDAVRSLRLQIRHDPAASVLNLNKPEVDKYKGFQSDSAIRRSDIIMAGTALSDYEINVLRRDEGVLVSHLVAIPRDLVFRDRSRPWLTRIQMQVASENAGLQIADAYLVVGTRTTGETDDAGARRLMERLLQQMVTDKRVKSKWVLKRRDPDKPLETLTCVGIHPKFIVSVERVAFEDSLRRGEPTEYSQDDVQLVDMTPHAVAGRKRGENGHH